MSSDSAIVIDFGSKYTRFIAKRIRELGVKCDVKDFSEILPGSDIDDFLKDDPGAIILSGGPPQSVRSEIPLVDTKLLEHGIPILGICFGSNVIVKSLGGIIENNNDNECSMSTISVVKSSGILNKLKIGEDLNVWMSYGDRVKTLPSGFEILAISENTPYASIANYAKRLYGVQFYPEITKSSESHDIISTFLFDIAKLKRSWIQLIENEKPAKRIMFEELNDLTERVNELRTCLGLPELTEKENSKSEQKLRVINGGR